MTQLKVMENNDRQSDDERRKEPRLKLSIEMEWSRGGDISPGTLSDLSRTGCFVLTKGEFDNGEVVRIYLPLTDGGRFEILGEITNNVEDVGFGVRFVNVSDVQREFLVNFAELHHHQL